jgi:hypothetical protein
MPRLLYIGTWHKWSLGGQFSKLCPVTLTSIQYGHLQRTYCRFSIGPYGKKCFKIFKDHSCHVCFTLAYWFQRIFFLNVFSIGSYVNTMSADGGHLGWRSAWQKCSLDGHIQDFCFGTNRKSNMAARANNVF